MPLIKSHDKNKSNKTSGFLKKKKCGLKEVKKSIIIIRRKINKYVGTKIFRIFSTNEIAIGNNKYKTIMIFNNFCLLIIIWICIRL